MALSLSICVLSTGCAATTGQPISRETLENMSYQSLWTRSGSARLQDGEYRERTVPGSATEVVVKITDHMAYGRIKSIETAAVVLVTDPGGSGTFFDLALIEKNQEGWVNTHVISLGDRVKIHSIAMENGEVVVEMTTHGPNDKMCCPTLRVVKRFAGPAMKSEDTDRDFHEDVSPAAKAGSMPASDGSGPAASNEARKAEIVGIVWKWQRTLYNNDTSAVPEDPHQYTLLLKPDGRAQIRADCNRGEGDYNLERKRISLEITNSTMAACPPGSLEKEYTRDLNAATIYFTEGGSLFIDLKFDSGTMKFSR